MVAEYSSSLLPVLFTSSKNVAGSEVVTVWVAGEKFAVIPVIIGMVRLAEVPALTSGLL